MTNIKEIFISNIAAEAFHEWAYEKTLREILDECNQEDWLLWILSHVLGVNSKEFIYLKAQCASLFTDIVDEEDNRQAILAAIEYGTDNGTYENWLEKKENAALRQQNISMDAYVIDNPQLIVKSMLSRWIYDDNTYTMFKNGSLIYSYLNPQFNHNLCMADILTIIRSNTQNLT